ncbi:MAG: DUF6443 domain-containing protein, partial [Owenweeksia sp.]
DIRLYQQGSGTPSTTLSNIQLSIDPDNDQVIQNGIQEEVFHIPSQDGKYKIEVEINSIVQNGSSISNIPDNILINIQTRVERYYSFNTLTAPTALQHVLIEDADNQVINSTPDVDVAYSNAEEIEIRWTCMPGAEEYELEWTHINDYKKAENEYYDAEDIALTDLEFKANNTRVIVSDTSYSIPLLYDRGFIVYRVRGVGRVGAADQVIKSVWTSGSSAETVEDYGYQRIAEHQQNKKWQSSMVFAEEGKKKELLNYMDGTQRSRQNVTRNSSENEVVVAETFYDHQGRPKIQVLPAPANDSKLDFYEDFNQDSQGDYYYRDIFDEDTQECSEAAPPMNEASGAARYYSSSNPDLSGENSFLPESYGYVFTETQYEADNTNRIKRQSGVGPGHTLGSNHDTRYFYNVPDQSELDRLFGTEVGHAEHYRKITIIDPNGQASITYQDLAGNVIATALTGNRPASMEPLKSGSIPLQNTVSTESTVDMLNKLSVNDADTDLDNNQRNASGKGLDLNYNFTYPDDDNFYGYYDVTIPAFTDGCITGYAPVMDLSIGFWSTACNTYLDGTSTQVGVYNAAFSGASSKLFEIGSTDSPLNLPEGGYRVEKSLSVNEKYLEDYAQHYAENASCLLSLEDFILEAWTDVDTTDCDTDTVLSSAGVWVYDCQSCLDDLGLFANFPGTQAEYDELKAQCEEPCEEYTSGCELILSSLFIDLTPGGQYATFEVDENGDYFSDDPLSIFNTGANEPNRLPVYLKGNTIDFNSLFDTDDLNQIILNWNETYTNAVLQFHPEWEYYNEACTDLTDVPSGFSLNSEEFDWIINSTLTFSEAETKGFIDPNDLTDYTLMLDSDPYFSVHTTEAGIMSSRLANIKNSGKDLFEYAAYQVSCGNWYSNLGGCSGISFGSSSQQYINDKHWQLAKGLYLSIKQEVIGYKYVVISLNAANIASNGFNNSHTGYFNGGIGYQKFNFSKY